MEILQDELLNGWVAISEVFKDSVDTTQKRYKRSLLTSNKMPVDTTGHPKAFRSQLLLWQRKEIEISLKEKAAEAREAAKLETVPA